MDGWNQKELVWLKRHLLRAHFVSFLHPLSNSTATGKMVWPFSGISKPDIIEEMCAVHGLMHSQATCFPPGPDKRGGGGLRDLTADTGPTRPPQGNSRKPWISLLSIIASDRMGKSFRLDKHISMQFLNVLFASEHSSRPFTITACSAVDVRVRAKCWGIFERLVG